MVHPQNTNLEVLTPRERPTMYFIGVSTAQSSIQTIFPRWMKILDVDLDLIGYDAPPGAPVFFYEDIIVQIKQDPKVWGALVTTHKIDIVTAMKDQFDTLDDVAKVLGEVSAISKLDGKLEGYAKDILSSREALAQMIPAGYWRETGAHVLCLGAGGAASAISVCMAQNDDMPKKFIVVDVDAARLERLDDLHHAMKSKLKIEYMIGGDANTNDNLLAQLPAGSLVINATGMGKDRPGSPISDMAVFPEGTIVWELNYRGDLWFLHQANKQKDTRNLKIYDGWTYFIHGWAQVIGEVAHKQITPEIMAQFFKSAEEAMIELDAQRVAEEEAAKQAALATVASTENQLVAQPPAETTPTVVVVPTISTEMLSGTSGI